VPIIAFADAIMGIFGPEFRSGASVLIVLCLGQLIVGLLGPVTSLLFMSKREKTVRTCTFAAAVLNVALHASAVPFFGALGAAFAFSISHSFSAISQALSLRRGIGQTR